MKLSIVIPVYNEKNTILAILRKVSEVSIEKEIIVVDDGSTDGTRELLQGLDVSHLTSHILRLKVVFQDRNMGKGAAIRRGLQEVTGDVVVIQDADLEYDPFDFVRLIRPIEDGTADVVYGSRILGHGKKSSLAFYFGGRLLSWLTNVLYGLHITDEPTCYKMFRTEAIQSLHLECDGFEFCPEVTAKAAKKGYRIVELPISYNPRKITEGKKIRWEDGVVAIWTLIKYRFWNG